MREARLETGECNKIIEPWQKKLRENIYMKVAA